MPLVIRSVSTGTSKCHNRAADIEVWACSILPHVMNSKMKFLQAITDAVRFGHYLRRAPHFLIVLGMHRSGTSCATRILNLMGASFGRSVVDVPALDNGEIHWESANTIWINDEVLSRAGGCWYDPPNTVRYTTRDRLRVRRYLLEFTGESVALIKDPRFLLTYDLWQRALSSYSIVVCLRHPMNVARSLETRDGIPLSDGLKLWMHYNVKLKEIMSAQVPTLAFDFDGGGAAAKLLVNQAAGKLGLEATSAAMQHYTADAKHHSDTGDLPSEVADLYHSIKDSIRTVNE